jgi:hypothetical protein
MLPRGETICCVIIALTDSQSRSAVGPVRNLVSVAYFHLAQQDFDEKKIQWGILLYSKYMRVLHAIATSGSTPLQ